MASNKLPLLPQPRGLRRRPGFYTFPSHSVLHLPAELPRDAVLLSLAERLQAAAEAAGFVIELVTGPPKHPRLAILAANNPEAPDHREGYTLSVSADGVRLGYQAVPGLRAAVATLRQLLREYGRRLPCLTIRDYPDFDRRGVMLDVSRGRVPTLATLLELVDRLADWKINEFQLYTEHTFAYRDYEPVWRDWGALTGEEILRLDARCRALGIDLVPNQNSFGHLRSWLEFPPLQRLAETPQPYPSADGTFLRYPTTLAPKHPGTMPFLCGLFDELLPHFTSPRFNVGCDETWDLGRGRSAALCAERGKGRVYLDFLLRIQAEVAARGRQMLFWGDIILHYPELIREMPRDVVALNWGYEADHPFAKETAVFAESGLPFYVCPGTSTWMTLLGRHDNAFVNLRRAAQAGRRNGAAGYLNTEWGDGGHPQPLAVSLPLFLMGAAVAWSEASFDEALLAPVLSRDVFQDSTQLAARAALALGVAHRRFEYTAPNITAFGAVIAAPRPETRELFCRDGLKYYARIPSRKIQSAWDEVERQRAILARSAPAGSAGAVLVEELDLAARMAGESCRIMLWQQALAEGRRGTVRQLAKEGRHQLAELDRDFRAYWPRRNKGTTAKCSPFLNWRMDDYRAGKLHFPPDLARG